jgi:hypothetical protein
VVGNVARGRFKMDLPRVRGKGEEEGEVMNNKLPMVCLVLLVVMLAFLNLHTQILLTEAWAREVKYQEMYDTCSAMLRGK